MDEVTKLLKEAQAGKFWGNIQLDFQDGELVLIRKTETIKVTRKEKPRDEYQKRP